MPRPPYSLRAERSGWRVSIPRARGAGSVRRWFPDHADAVVWADANYTAIRTGADAVLSPAQSAEYRAAAALLPPGASLIDAARAYAKTASATAHLRPISAPDAVSLYIDARRSANLRPSSLRNIRAFCGKLPAAPLASIVAGDLAPILSTMRPLTRNSHIASWRAFFRWAIRDGFASANPAERLDIALIDFTPPEIYAPEAARAVFATAAAEDPSFVCYLAVAAFAGVRSSAIRKLSASDVDPVRGVFVPARADKMRLAYYVEANAPLSAWLAAHPFKGFPDSRVAYQNREAALFRKAGVAKVRNGWRHSFGSYAAALHGPVAAAASLGHLGGDTATLLTHYRRLATPERAREYFSILPQSSHKPDSSS
jgi:integrase